MVLPAHVSAAEAALAVMCTLTERLSSGEAADVLDHAVAWASELAAKDRNVLSEHKRLTYGTAIEICGA